MMNSSNDKIDVTDFSLYYFNDLNEGIEITESDTYLIKNLESSNLFHDCLSNLWQDRSIYGKLPNGQGILYFAQIKSLSKKDDKISVKYQMLNQDNLMVDIKNVRKLEKDEFSDGLYEIPNDMELKRLVKLMIRETQESYWNTLLYQLAQGFTTFYNNGIFIDPLPNLSNLLIKWDFKKKILSFIVLPTFHLYQNYKYLAKDRNNNQQDAIFRQRCIPTIFAWFINSICLRLNSQFIDRYVLSSIISSSKEGGVSLEIQQKNIIKILQNYDQRNQKCIQERLDKYNYSINVYEKYKDKLIVDFKTFDQNHYLYAENESIVQNEEKIEEEKNIYNFNEDYEQLIVEGIKAYNPHLTIDNLEFQGLCKYFFELVIMSFNPTLELCVASPDFLRIIPFQPGIQPYLDDYLLLSLLIQNRQMQFVKFRDLIKDDKIQKNEKHYENREKFLNRVLEFLKGLQNHNDQRQTYSEIKTEYQLNLENSFDQSKLQGDKGKVLSKFDSIFRLYKHTLQIQENRLYNTNLKIKSVNIVTPQNNINTPNNQNNQKSVQIQNQPHRTSILIMFNIDTKLFKWPTNIPQSGLTREFIIEYLESKHCLIVKSSIQELSIQIDVADEISYLMALLQTNDQYVNIFFNENKKLTILHTYCVFSQIEFVPAIFKIIDIQIIYHLLILDTFYRKIQPGRHGQEWRLRISDLDIQKALKAQDQKHKAFFRIFQDYKKVQNMEYEDLEKYFY